MPSPHWKSVRIPAEALTLIQELHSVVIRHGWTALGATREDVPTMGALLEECVRQARERIKGL